VNWHPVRPPARWRWRRVWPRLGAWLRLGVWVGGTAWAVGYTAAHDPQPTLLGTVVAGVGFALMLGAALIPRLSEGQDE